jgi:hypothetical protein
MKIKVPNLRSMRDFKGGRPDPSPSTSSPPCQQYFHPLTRALAKQPPTRVTPRSPQNADLQCLRVVVSRLSRWPRCPRPVLRPHRDNGSNCLDEAFKATTDTITNKSLQVNLQLTHELGGYIRWMRSRTPTENLKNTSNTKIHRLSLSATPRLPLRLGGY